MFQTTLMEVSEGDMVSDRMTGEVYQISAITVTLDDREGHLTTYFSMTNGKIVSINGVWPLLDYPYEHCGDFELKRKCTWLQSLAPGRVGRSVRRVKCVIASARSTTKSLMSRLKRNKSVKIVV